jgi:transglutaminase-like putative cysteine protease
MMSQRRAGRLLQRRIDTFRTPRKPMRLKAACDMTLEASEICPTIGMLRPRSGLAQWLASESYHFNPHVHTTEYVDAYGNLCQRFVIPHGTMRIRVEAVVETEDTIAVEPLATPTPVELLPDDALQFLLQSRYCPSDKMCDKANEITSGFAPGYPQVEAIRAWIHSNIEYKYGVSTATTDAMDTLEMGAGVCRDYSHVGMSLCRALRIPARMVVGYLYQLDPMDLHAWFEAFVGGRWYTFDATQDQPCGGRIVVAYGRDAADVAFISNYGPLETKDMHVTVELDNTHFPD